MKTIKTFLLFSGVFVFGNSFAQINVAFNSNGAAANSSAILDLSGGVTTGSKGFLPPQVTLTATNVAAPVTGAATGLLVYNVATAGTAPNNVVPGYYYWSGTAWVYWINNSKVTAPIPGLLLNATVANRSYNPGFNLVKDNFNDYPSGPGTVSPDAAYHGDNCTVVTSTGNFSKVYGWVNGSVLNKTITISAYLYTPVNNSSANLVGTLLGSQTITITTASANYYYEITGNTAVSKGQFIKVWFTPNFNMQLYSIGTVECTYIPQ